MHNHATPVAILGALDSTPIRRLTQVWAVRNLGCTPTLIADGYTIASDT